MSSINTNAASMIAMQTLKATNKILDATQNRISTGYRVSEAAHNAAYWSIATTMRSDNSAMSTVQDALGLGAAQVDVAYTAMDAVKDTLDQIKTKVVAASQPDIDKGKIQEEINQLQNDLKTYARSATFSGGNWLDVENFGTQKVVASFLRGASGAISLGTIDVDTSKTALFTNSPNINDRGMLEEKLDLTDEGSGRPPNVVALGTSGTGVVPGWVPVALGALAAGATTNSDGVTPATAELDDFDAPSWQAGDIFRFNVEVNGGAPVMVEVIASASGFDDASLNAALTGAGLSVTASGAATGTVTFTGSTGLGDTVDVSGFTGIRSIATTPITIAGFDNIGWIEDDIFTLEIDIEGVTSQITGTYDGSAWAWSNQPSGIYIAVDDAGMLEASILTTAGAPGDEVSISSYTLKSERPSYVPPAQLDGPDVGSLLPWAGSIDGALDSEAIIIGAGALSWSKGDTFSFEVTINDAGPAIPVVGSYDGTNWHWEGLPFGVTASLNSNDLVVTLAGGSPDAVAGEAFDVSNFSSTTLPEITVTNFDITDMSREELQLLLDEIDKALGSIATAASDLGAIKTRISSWSAP